MNKDALILFVSGFLFTFADTSGWKWIWPGMAGIVCAIILQRIWP